MKWQISLHARKVGRRRRFHVAIAHRICAIHSGNSLDFGQHNYTNKYEVKTHAHTSNRIERKNVFDVPKPFHGNEIFSSEIVSLSHIVSGWLPHTDTIAIGSMDRLPLEMAHNFSVPMSASYRLHASFSLQERQPFDTTRPETRIACVCICVYVCVRVSAASVAERCCCCCSCSPIGLAAFSWHFRSVCPCVCAPNTHD